MAVFVRILPSSSVINHRTVQSYIDQAAVAFLFLLYFVLKNLRFLLSFVLSFLF